MFDATNMDDLLMIKKISFIIILFLMWNIVYAAEPLETGYWDCLPKVVAEFDGRKITRENLVRNIVVAKTTLIGASRDKLESIAKITLKEQLEKYLITRLMRRDGFIPSKEVALREYQRLFASFSLAKQSAYLKKMRLTRAQLSAHWQQLCRKPAEQFRMTFLLWLKSKLLNTKVSAEEIETFYRNYQDKFKRPGKISINSLMIKYVNKSERQAAKNRAEDILALLRQGVDFDQQADKFGVQDDALTGDFTRGVLPAKIAKVAFAMKTGEISDVIEMPIGFIIVKVKQKIAAGYIPLAKVKNGLALELKRNKVRRWLRKAVTLERAKSDIKIFI